MDKSRLGNVDAVVFEAQPITSYGDDYKRDPPNWPQVLSTFVVMLDVLYVSSRLCVPVRFYVSKEISVSKMGQHWIRNSVLLSLVCRYWLSGGWALSTQRFTSDHLFSLALCATGFR